MKTALWDIALLVSFVIFSLAAAEEEAPGPGLDPKADALLHKLADFYQKTPNLSVDVAYALKIETPGTRRETWARYQVAFERPNKAAIVLKDGVGATVISDGLRVFTFVPAMNKYTEKNAPESLDALLREDELALVSRSMGDLLFVDQLMRAEPYEAIVKDLTGARYMGVVDQGGRRVHHLKLTEKEYGWNLWVDEGERPFVRKIAVDIAAALEESTRNVPHLKETQVDMGVAFQNWTAGAPIPAERFRFDPPEGVQKAMSFFDSGEDGAATLVGKPAPPMKLELLHGGKVDLAEHKGKHIVVLDFWATWCAPCVHTLAAVAGTAQDYADRGVVFYGVNQVEEAEAITTFLESRKLDFNVALDKDAAVANAYGVRGLPQTVIIGKDGRVKAVHSGAPQNIKDAISKDLEKLLANEPVPVSR